MQRAVRAALLSALVFPGAGQLFLRRPLRACVFIVPAVAALLYLVGDVMRVATAMADQVLAGTLPLDPVVLAARLHAQGGLPGSATASSAVLVACWAASIVDAFVLAHGAGRRAE